MSAIATIGVYDFTAERFLAALHGAKVTVLLDVRQRRGVRGSEYAWANARRLEKSLAEAGIEYRHLRELAPTTEMRRLQYREDALLGVGQRSRATLAPEFADRFRREVLDQADLGSVVRDLPDRGLAALLCVERDPEACHRSLIAERLASEHGLRVRHLQP